MAKLNADGYFPYTPPTPLLHGLKAALGRLHAEGLDAVIARHHRLAAGVRRAVSAWGLDLVAEHRSLWSDTVSAIRVPATVDAREVLRIAYSDFNTSFGSGLGLLAGKAFRIGHLGDLNEGMCLAAIGIAEMAMHRAGVPVELGAGVGAAQAVYAGQDAGRAPLDIAAE